MPTPSLSKLQKSINTDTRLRNQFLKDPGGVLAKNGLELPAAKAKQLADFTKEVTAAKGQVAVGGISRKVTGAGANAKVEVEVSVTVRF
jgi:isopentenyl phosphate kinase